MKNEQISFVDIISLLLQHWWKVLIASVVSAVAFYFFTVYCIMPTYTSRGSVYVNNSSGLEMNEPYVNLSDIATSQQLAFTFIEILTSDTFLTRVQQESGLPYTPSQIKSMISLEPLNETEIVEVKALTYYPEHSQKLVATILDNALDEIHRVYGGGNVKIIDDATLPQHPTSPSKSKNTILGFLVGTFFSTLLIFVINLFDNRIKLDTDLMDVKELPLLGIIPDGDYVRAEVKKNAKK